MKFRYWGKKHHLGIFVFIFIIMFLSFVYSFDIDTAYSYDFLGQEDDGSVLDCIDKNKGCERKFINMTLENCDEWYVHQPIEELTCNMTKEGVEEVVMIADPANYITGKFTNLTYTVEILRRDPIRLGYYKFIPTGLVLFTAEGKKLFKTWDLEFLPDGSYLVTQKNGRLVHYRDGKFEHVDELEVLDVKLAGLMGLAIDPNYEENHFIYLYYTVSFDNSYPRQNYNLNSRISRFVYKDGILSDEKILLDNIPGSLFHAGGGLEFGPDGKLYASTGDAAAEDLSQDINFLGGKILRINPDGTIPSDNPFTNSYVYSRGHRNSQGLAWHPETLDLYASEHGNWRYDEINLIEKGGNYGWGSMQCDEVMDARIPIRGNAIPPIKCFKDWTFAPNGAVFVTDMNHPWYGNLFVAGLRGKHLHRFVIENNQIVNNEIFFVNIDTQKKSNLDRRIRDVEFYNGSLWILSDWSGVAKLTPI